MDNFYSHKTWSSRSCAAAAPAHGVILADQTTRVLNGLQDCMYGRPVHEDQILPNLSVCPKAV